MQAKIDGFDVTLEDGQCWVQQGNCIGSLPAIESEGQIESPSAYDDPIEIPVRTVGRIRAWADANGF